MYAGQTKEAGAYHTIWCGFSVHGGVKTSEPYEKIVVPWGGGVLISFTAVGGV